MASTKGVRRVGAPSAAGSTKNRRPPSPKVRRRQAEAAAEAEFALALEQVSTPEQARGLAERMPGKRACGRHLYEHLSYFLDTGMSAPGSTLAEATRLVQLRLRLEQFYRRGSGRRP